MTIGRTAYLGTLLRSVGREQKYFIFLALDVAFIAVALAVSLSLNVLPFGFPPVSVALLVAVPCLSLIGAGLLVAARLPRIQLAEFDVGATARVAMVAGALALAGYGLTSALGLRLSVPVYLGFGTTFFALVFLSRIVMLQIVLAIYRRSGEVTRVLIYGAGATGMQLVQAFRSHRGIDPVAFVDDNPSMHGLRIAGLPVYTPIRIAQIVADKKIDRVLLAVPSLSPPKQARIARNLQELGIEVQTLPSFSQLIGTEALIDRLETLKPRILLGREEVRTGLMHGSASYRDKSILVSGAGGSIGAELCRQVLECRPRRLVLFELSEAGLFTVHRELRKTADDIEVELVPVIGSVCDARQVRQAIEENGVEVILHAAAYKHVALVQQNPLAGLSNNVLGTQTIAAAAVAAGIERFILVSTDKAVRPRGVMGASKRLAELVVQDIAGRVPEGGTILSMVRFGNVLGSSGSVVPIFQEQIRRGGPVTVTHPHVTRYFMTIEEAARLVLRAGSLADGGEVLLLDMGEPVKILELARQAIEKAGFTVQSDLNPHGDIAIRYIGLSEGEKLHEELFFDGTEKPTADHKIFRLREPGLSQIEMAEALRTLRAAVDAGDREAALDMLRRRITGFGADAARAVEAVPGVPLARDIDIA